MEQLIQETEDEIELEQLEEDVEKMIEESEE